MVQVILMSQVMVAGMNWKKVVKLSRRPGHTDSFKELRFRTSLWFTG